MVVWRKKKCREGARDMIIEREFLTDSLGLF